VGAFQVISPVDGSVYLERGLHEGAAIERALSAATKAQRAWQGVFLEERRDICRRFSAAVRSHKDAWGLELTWQMGRPIAYAPNELRTCADRADAMIELAPEALARVETKPREGFVRYIERAPLGVVLVVPAWNFPWLIAVNSIVPALLAGNAVVLKHSEQTPLVAERFADAFREAGLPEGLLQVLHLTHEDTARVIRDERTAFVAFTGSVRGGHAMEHASADRFVGVGLELGGKDPAYVRSDAKLDFAVENLVDGAFFNSGQSCCGIERIYVHEKLYEGFVEGFVELTKRYRLEDPTNPEAQLGPMAKKSGADTVRAHVEEAIARGARSLVDTKGFARHGEGSYVAPQVLVDVDHQMRLMREETFGPAVGIMRVASDDEAVRLMNDSAFGLTASVWSEDLDAALALGARVETGTFFLNRCDFLDPELAWVGVKDSGRGCTLSRLGYEQLTRPKSFHLRTRSS
jgi:acyl-CoA reductase-like NAD-dependent aldehyde dehydrogenase